MLVVATCGVPAAVTPGGGGGGTPEAVCAVATAETVGVSMLARSPPKFFLARVMYAARLLGLAVNDFASDTASVARAPLVVRVKVTAAARRPPAAAVEVTGPQPVIHASELVL